MASIRIPPSTTAANPRRLTSDRLLGTLLILLQLLLLAYLSRARVFPVVLMLATLWGLRTRVRLQIDPLPRSLLYAVLSIGFLLHYMFAPYPLAADFQFIRSSLAHSIARLLLTIQVLQLYLDHDRGRLPIWLASCGAIALSFAANVRAPSVMHDNLHWLIAAFVGCFALYVSRARQAVETGSRTQSLRGLLMSVALLVAVGLGTLSSWALHRHERDIEWFLADYLGYGGGTARTGFSPNGRLESVSAWKTDGRELVRLRIFSDAAPGYLRGKAFDKYQGSSRETSYTAWVTTVPRQMLEESDRTRGLPPLRRGDRLYELDSTFDADLRLLDIWPAEGSEARLFTPLGTSMVAINSEQMRVDGHGIVTIDDRIDAMPYMVLAPDQGEAITGSDDGASTANDHRILTALDGHIDPEVRKLAGDLFADSRTTRDKIAAVESYFHNNYRYKLGINVPHRMDPITYFLTKQPPAHCEYFATGTALLLRLADVPCRYVIGYVSAEWNSVGGFWVARNKDAHAWVEALDEQTGEWIIVESTPADGVPQPRDPPLRTKLADTFQQRLSIWRMTLKEYGVTTLWLSAVDVVWSIPGLVFLLAILGSLLIRYRPKVFVWHKRYRPPAYLKEMHQALTRLDRVTRQHGFERQTGETLMQFAHRLQTSATDHDWAIATARCYGLYAELRYRDETGPDAVQQLREAASAIPTIVNTKRDRRLSN